MKKSELVKIIKEEINSILKENVEFTGNNAYVSVSYSSWDHFMRKYAPITFKKFKLSNPHRVCGEEDTGLVLPTIRLALSKELKQNINKMDKEEKKWTTKTFLHILSDKKVTSR